MTKVPDVVPEMLHRVDVSDKVFLRNNMLIIFSI